MFTILLPMVERMHDRIRVAVIFDHSAVRPVWFDRRGRQVRVREIALAWSSRVGSAEIAHFSVSDGTNRYELTFNRETLQWHLAAAEVP